MTYWTLKENSLGQERGRLTCERDTNLREKIIKVQERVEVSHDIEMKKLSTI